MSILVALLLGSATIYAETPSEELELNASLGGASQILAEFSKDKETPEEEIGAMLEPIAAQAENGGSLITTDPIAYTNPLEGFACVEEDLSVFRSASVLAPVIAYTQKEGAVNVIGEHMVNGERWYRITVGDVEGYAMSKDIKFGEEAEKYIADQKERQKAEATMPASIAVLDDISDLPAEVQQKITSTVSYINYALRVDYPKAVQENQVRSQFTLTQYLLRNYWALAEQTSANHLGNTDHQAYLDILAITYVQQKICESVGKTAEELQAEIQAAARAEANRKQLIGTNPNPNGQGTDLGNQIAQYAASFVGIMPYVWGGASLTTGADCSGFVGQIMAHFGLLDQAKADSHYYDSRGLRYVGRAVSVNEILPGDIVCYDGHVAIYYGNGDCVHSPNVGRKVEYGTLYMKQILTIRRLY